jgi:hypothetical protein
MNSPWVHPTMPALSGWKLLFEAALLEFDPELLPHRLWQAKDAMMDRLEESFDTVSLSERRQLIAAFNTISELEATYPRDTLDSPKFVSRFGAAA